MFYLFHGDDTFISRQKFSNALSSYTEFESFPAKSITPEILVNHSNGGLFGTQKKALILEHAFSLHPSTLKKIISQIEKVKNIDFFFWEERKITPAKISLLGNDKRVILSQIPAVVFKFLDSFGRGDISLSLKFLDKTFKTHPSELILFLLIKRVRDLIVIKSDPNLFKGAPWQKSVLKKQSENLDLEDMTKIYLKLIDIEYKNKTGRLGNNLDNELINIVTEIQ